MPEIAVGYGVHCMSNLRVQLNGCLVLTGILYKTASLVPGHTVVLVLR